MEGAGAWVHSGADFGADGRRVQVRPLGLEAAELGHGALQLPAKGAVLEGGEERVECFRMLRNCLCQPSKLFDPAFKYALC